MSRKKTPRFELSKRLDNVLEPGKALFEEIKGHWRQDFFKNDNPIVLELGCGKGEYTVGLAGIFPEKNFIGVDIKGDRIAVGAKKAFDAQMSNVGFLRTKIHDLVHFFAPNEVAEIWVTFPDPHPLQSGIKKRLTYPRFLALYQEILQAEGLFHLKTDSTLLFEYSLEVLQEMAVQDLIYTDNLYASELNVRHYGIKTRFEELFTAKGFDIKYLACRLNKQ